MFTYGHFFTAVLDKNRATELYFFFNLISKLLCALYVQGLFIRVTII